MEEAKKWSFAITLTFIFVAVPLTLLVLLQNPNKSCEFMDTILGILGVNDSIYPSGNHKVDEDQIPDLSVSPNLSSCHPSYGRPDLLVDCCPPASEFGEEVIINFQFPDPSTPLRVRRPAHHVDEEYIAKYKRALTIMKSLPHSDPRSFSRQANLHCIYCTGAYDLPHSHLPLNIHNGWFFFPWHRMMLHFHERILGSLIGDDTFALPFWNWDSPDAMTSPELYLNEPFFHYKRDFSHFPPKIGDLNFHEDNDIEPEEKIYVNLAFMYKQVVSSAKKPELFMGCPSKAGEGGACHGPGTVEIAPHDTMHVWVGSSFNPSREDMGAFYSAAWDPMFYSHHANIDRLWEVWRGIHKFDLENMDPDWLNSSFYFHDENSQLVRIYIRDVLNITKLRCDYEDVALPWLNMRPKPSVPSKIVNHALNKTMLQSPHERIFSAEFGPSGRNLGSSVTVKVQRSAYNRRKQEKEEEEEVLVVHGIDVRTDAHVKFDVYINLVDESIISPSLREFAGTFVHMPSGKRAGNRKANLKLGISEVIEDLEADGDESIWVTLIPRTKSCNYTIFDGLRIEYMR